MATLLAHTGVLVEAWRTGTLLSDAGMHELAAAHAAAEATQPDEQTALLDAASRLLQVSDKRSMMLSADNDVVQLTVVATVVWLGPDMKATAAGQIRALLDGQA